MSLQNVDRLKPDLYEPEPAIRLGVTAREASETRWGLILVVFMRLLAGLWIIQGLAQWAVFLLPADAVFDRQSAGRTAAVIFFSVLDLLAGVGLWLATPWGGVLWLFAALSQIFIAMSITHFFTYVWVAVDGSLILLYFRIDVARREGLAALRLSPDKPELSYDPLPIVYLP